MRRALLLISFAVLLLPMEAAAHARGTLQDTTKEQPARRDTSSKELTLDEQLFFSINHWGSEGAWLDGPAVFLSNTAFYAVLAAPVGIYAYGRATRSSREMTAGVTTLLSVGVSSLITEGIKYIVQRDRPYRALDGWRTPDTLMLPSDYSFPSGHATATWALASALSFHYPKWYVIAPAAFYALSVSLSRPYVAAHYPSDIVAGAIIGVATSYALWRLEPSIFAKTGNLVNPSSSSSIVHQASWQGTILFIPVSLGF